MSSRTYPPKNGVLATEEESICGHSRILAFITEAAPVERILTHIGEPTQPPLIFPARGPPAWYDGLAEAVPDRDALAQPEPEYLFDQQV